MIVKKISDAHFSEILAKNKLFNSIFIGFVSFFLKTLRHFLKKNSTGEIVIISLHKIGDTIFTFPALRAVDQYYPGRTKTILCHQSGKEIYDSLLPGFNTIPLKHEMFSLGRRFAAKKARAILRNLKPEIIIDFTACMTSFTLIFDSRASIIYGSNKEIFKGVYDYFTPVRHRPGLPDIYLDAIKPVIKGAANFNTAISDFRLKSQGHILIHPFAGWRAKEWGINRFIQLAIRLQREYNVEFIMEENSLTYELVEELKFADIKVITTKSLTDLINRIKLSALVISNDTGCIYIAEVLEKATYTIYGPSNPMFTFPVGNKHAMIQKQLLCSPTFDKICFTHGGRKGCPSIECMRQLSFSDVYNHLTEHLENSEIKKMLIRNNLDGESEKLGVEQ